MQKFEGGIKRQYGSFVLVELSGSWEEMGRQYGHLLAPQLEKLYRGAIENDLPQKEGVSVDEMKVSAESFFAHYPARFKAMVRGMAQTSGLTLSQHVLLNALDFIKPNPMDHLHCANMAVWGEYAAGPLVFARQSDYYPWLKAYADCLVITVLHPSDGSASTAFVSWAGGVSGTTAINQHQVLCAINSGVPSGGALCYDSRVPTPALMLGVLLDSETLDDVEGFLQSSKSNFACIVATADAQTTRCYEWPVFEVKRRQSLHRPGLMVATNHFTEFSWGLPRPHDESFWQTRSKRQNLLNMAEHLKGSLDPKRIQKIMETHYDDLGALSDQTVWQLVVVPQTLEMWIRVPSITAWTPIPLGETLSPQEE